MQCAKCHTENLADAAFCEECAAPLLAPALCEWRAELAGVLGDEAERARLLEEARVGYGNIGAPRHAERLGEAKRQGGR